MKRYKSQQKDETAIEFLRRLVSNCNHETESLLEDLPTVDSVCEYFDLWEVYDTDLMVGIEAAILDGSNPEPLERFIDKHDLPWTPPSKWKKEGKS